MANTILPPYRHRVPPPSYGAGWMLQELVNLEQKIGGSASAALWPYAVQPTDADVVHQNYPYLDIRRYGNVSNGSDITTPLTRACAAVVGSPVKGIYIPGGSYSVGATTALTSSHPGIAIRSDGAGSCTITRTFNGPLFTLASVLGFRLHDIAFNGAYGTQTGKGIVLSGTCNYPRITECDFIGFSDAHIEFGADCGYHAKLIGNHHFTGPGQSDFLTVHTSGPDTTATPRQFVAVDTNGYHDMSGALDAQFAGCFQTRIETDVNTTEFTCASSVWADQVNFLAGIPITLKGVNMFITATRFANAVMLASGSSGAISGAGPSGVPIGLDALTDNSGGTWAIGGYRELGKLFHWFARSSLTATVTGEIRQASVTEFGDVGGSYTVDVDSSVLVWNQAAFTSDHTLTLNTTNARNGCTVDVWRTAGDTGGPWTLTIGTTGVALSSGQKATAIYTGSQWIAL